MSGVFRDRVRAIVRTVPRGRVVTYGQVAALAGKPRGAREVGWIAAAGGADIPWQRVVNRGGGLAAGYTGGRAGHRRALRRDGVNVRGNLTVDLHRYRWWPGPAAVRRLHLPLDALAAVTSPRTRRKTSPPTSRSAATRRR